jgi:hypothetical protein
MKIKKKKKGGKWCELKGKRKMEKYVIFIRQTATTKAAAVAVAKKGNRNILRMRRKFEMDT